VNTFAIFDLRFRVDSGLVLLNTPRSWGIPIPMQKEEKMVKPRVTVVGVVRPDPRSKSLVLIWRNLSLGKPSIYVVDSMVLKKGPGLL